MSHLEKNMLGYLRGVGLPEPEQQYRFDPSRRWRIDFAWPAVMLAVELDGGTQGRPVTCHQCGCRVRAMKKGGKLGRELRIGGGHSRGDSHRAQYEKQNALIRAGWVLLRYDSQQLREDTPVVLNEILETYQALRVNQ